MFVPVILLIIFGYIAFTIYFRNKLKLRHYEALQKLCVMKFSLDSNYNDFEGELDSIIRMMSIYKPLHYFDSVGDIRMNDFYNLIDKTNKNSDNLSYEKLKSRMDRLHNQAVSIFDEVYTPPIIV